MFIQTITFWVLLGLAVPAYWLMPARFRMAFLAVLSISYLSFYDAFSTAALALWTLLCYFAAPYTQISGRKGWALLIAIILSVLGFLAYFKYVPPLVLAIIGGGSTTTFLIPLGISYYTFKLVHFIVETSRGNIKGRSFWTFVCYMYLFPIFTAGPIERFDHFVSNQATAWSLDTCAAAVTRIVHGLIKKLVLVEFLSFHALDRLTAAELIERTHYYSSSLVWLYMVCVYLRLYLDFSAYSDIAIGASRLFGLGIMENFNYPIFARNIGDFWKRWHMSLGNWCQSYVYMPILGLYRNPYLSLYASLIVFAVWHAGTLTRLTWGIYQATGVALYMTWTRWKRNRGWKPKPGFVHAIPQMLFAQIWIVSSMTFLVAEGPGSFRDALRLLAKLVFVDLSV